MTDDPQQSGAERTARFEAALRADLHAGRRRTIAEYLAEFPDLEFHVADRIAEVRVEEFASRTGTGGGSAPAGVVAAGTPQKIGDYRIVRELGRGGQGVVYLAEDGRLRRMVALKVIAIASPRSGEAVARFRKEAEAAARIDHPGVCPVYEAGVLEGVAFLAMRYVEGETLANVIATRRADRFPQSQNAAAGASRDEILRVVESAARALHAAHAKGVVHRDIKPANIMIGVDGDPVILDFGLARDDDPAAPSLTDTKDAVGTPAYMAPEQVRSGAGRPDHRADVYALGAVLYEMLLLRRPFEAPTRELLYRAILLEEPSGLGRGSGTLPADVRVVLATALEKDRDRRYRTALDFAEDLARLRAGQPLHARPPGAGRRLALWRRRHPTAAALLAFAVLATAAFVAWQHRAIEELRASRDDERLARTRAEGLRFAAESVVEAERDPALGLALALEAETRAPGIEARNAVYGALLKNRERLTFLGHDDQVTACALTPDDRTAITGDASGLWLAWDVATGRVRARLEGPVARPRLATCSPDGAYVCFALENGGVWLWRWADSAPPVAIAPIKLAKTCAFDAGGGRLLAAADSEGWVVWDVKAGRAVRASEDHDFLTAALSADGTRVVAVSARSTAILDLETGASIVLPGDAMVRCAAHPREPLFALTEGPDAVVRRFADGGIVARLAGAGDPTFGLKFVGDGSRISVQSKNALITWADGKTAAVFEPPPIDDVGGNRRVSSPDGRRFLSWGAVETGAAGIWDDAGRYRGALRGSRYWIAGAVTSSNAEFAVVASRDGTARVYGLEEPLRAESEPKTFMEFGAFCRDGRSIVQRPCGDAPDRRDLVAVDTFGTASRRVLCTQAPVADLMLLDASRRHAMQVDREGRFIMIDLASGALLCDGAVLRPAPSVVGTPPISLADFSTETRTYLARAWGPNWETWQDFVADADGARPPRLVRSGLRNFVRLKLSPDGKRTIGPDGEDRTATVCDAIKGGEITRLAGHTGWVVDAEWSPDGSRIATAAVDTSIRIFRADDYALERVLRGIKMAEARVAFSFDGRIVAALAGGQVNLFDATTGEPLAAIDGFGSRSEQGLPLFTEDGDWLILALAHDAFRLPLDPVAYARAHLPRALDFKDSARFGVGTPEQRIEFLARLSADQPSARNLYSEGLARLDAGDRAGARRAFASAVELRPRHRFGHQGLAYADAAEGLIAEGLTALRSAVNAGGISADDLRSDPRLAPLRSDPGFEDVLRAAK